MLSLLLFLITNIPCSPYYINIYWLNAFIFALNKQLNKEKPLYIKTHPNLTFMKQVDVLPSKKQVLG